MIDAWKWIKLPKLYIQTLLKNDGYYTIFLKTEINLPARGFEPYTLLFKISLKIINYYSKKERKKKVLDIIIQV